MKRFISTKLNLEPIQQRLAPINEFVPIQELLSNFKHERITTWHDKVEFWHIFFAWVSIVILFGLIFFYASNPASNLTYTHTQKPVADLMDHIYFSFITATTTGFGDIVPVGYFKILAIIEVTFGLLLLAVVTSKFISIKQDIILTEIYEISFFEKINRIRSSLLLFRQNAGRLISKIEDGTIQKREIHDLYTLLSPLEDILSELSPLVNPQSKNLFTKVLDGTNTELLLTSITHSFEKLEELLKILNDKDQEWRRDITLNVISHSIDLNNSLFEKINRLHTLDIARADELTELNKAIILKLGEQIRHKTAIDHMP